MGVPPPMKCIYGPRQTSELTGQRFSVAEAFQAHQVMQVPIVQGKELLLRSEEQDMQGADSLPASVLVVPLPLPLLIQGLGLLLDRSPASCTNIMRLVDLGDAEPTRQLACQFPTWNSTSPPTFPRRMMTASICFSSPQRTLGGRVTSVPGQLLPQLTASTAAATQSWQHELL